MTDKELRRLSRTELLELLLTQSRESERLRRELEEVKQQLASRQLQVQEAGSIAEASMRLHQLFESSQLAADQYLENVRRLTAEQEEICRQREQESTARAQELIDSAEKQRSQILQQAQAEADAYWQEASRKIRELMAQQEGLREKLAVSLVQE